MEAATVDLGQAPEPFSFEQLDSALELREGFFQPSVGKIGQCLTSERLGDRPELAHLTPPSNMCSMLLGPPC